MDATYWNDRLGERRPIRNARKMEFKGFEGFRFCVGRIEDSDFFAVTELRSGLEVGWGKRIKDARECAEKRLAKQTPRSVETAIVVALSRQTNGVA